MALHCPNCGEASLRNQARFCDTCGALLISAPDDEATRPMPEFEAPTDTGLTRLMPEITLPPASGPTQLAKPEAALADGSSRSMLEIQPAGAKSLAPDVATAEPAQETLLMAGADLPAGYVIQIQNRYHLIEILGKGGFGAAYLADDTKLNRRCVVKQMLAKRRSTKELALHRANFEREARLLVTLNDPGHANIPEIYDYFFDESGDYLVMKYIEGRNLKEVLEQSENKLPWREAVRYALEMCSALHYMHLHGRKPVMHRDIKPANILLGNDGRIWLVDFGLAKANPVGDSSDNPQVTRALGSLGYSPLEQWLGQAVPASDIYALGATLHHLVTGVNPLDAYIGEFHVKKLQERHGQFPPIRKLDPKLPKALEEMISRATATEPEQRPTALQLQQQFQVLTSGAQGAALYTFKNGKSAQTVSQLVDLCEQNRREAEKYLYRGDFERWFLLTNRNDLAEAATQAIKQGKNQPDGLEKFLKLIWPNLFLRRLGKAGLNVVGESLKFGLTTVLIVLLLSVAGSFIAAWFIQQSISSADWNFYTLNLDRENRFSEQFVTQKFRLLLGAYFNDIRVKIHGPDQFNFTANWYTIPLDLPMSLRRQGNRPYISLTRINGMPLYLITDNLTWGINNGLTRAIEQGPVDLTRLVVRDGEIIFNVVDSPDPRPPFGTPTPTPTPIPTPTVTPTPVNNTLVVVFNELEHDISLEIEAQPENILVQTIRGLETSPLNWKLDIPAKGTQVLEIPPGTYAYKVVYKVRYEEAAQIAAQGEKIWTLNKAYRLHITENP